MSKDMQPTIFVTEMDEIHGKLIKLGHTKIDEEMFYLWLSDFEQGHLSYLAQLDKELREGVWNDNHFWPF